MSQDSPDTQAIQKLGEARDAIVKEVRKTIVGMEDVKFRASKTVRPEMKAAKIERIQANTGEKPPLFRFKK